ncbi:MAG: ABC transporter permease [Candidatus Polarisedimenticolia bacterium]
MLSGLRQILRGLSRQAGVSVAAVLTLALGTGTATLLFTVIDAVLLRPLPYPEAHRLVMLFESNPVDRNDRYQVSYANFLDWRQAPSSMDGMAACARSQSILRGSGEPARLETALVSSELFTLLGVAPVRGRLFGPGDERPGAPQVAIIGESLWRGRLGGDPQILGRPLVLDGESWTVVGVLPDTFRFPDAGIQVWMPLGLFADAHWMKNRSVHIGSVVARLAPGAGLDTARAEMALAMEGVHRAHPDEDPGHGVTVVRLQDQVVQASRPALLVLALSVGLLGLIACANVAGLLLARGVHRQPETALRAALGAGRARLLRHSLAESGLLAISGSLLGVATAWWALGPILAGLPFSLPRTQEIALDGRVLVFCLAGCLAATLLAGALPALQASRSDPARLLGQSGGRATAGAMLRRGGHALVAGQIALTMVLLIGAGLAGRSLSRLLEVDPGFRSEKLLTLSVSLPDTYERVEQVTGFYTQVTGTLGSLPGVEAVTAVNALPLSGRDSHGYLTVEQKPLPPDRTPEASFRRVLPGYFRTMRIPLLEGREFDERDGRSGPDAPMVVVVSRALARRFWPDGGALGQRIKVGPPESEPWLTIVGVAGDVHNVELAASPELATYEPLAQRSRRSMHLVVRATDDPGRLAEAARAAVHSLEKDALVDQVRTMEDRIGASVAAARWSAGLLAAFGAAALGLAALGLYALISFIVASRTREMGVRAAMGAPRAQLIRLVLAEGLKLSLVGMAAGLLTGLALTRALRSMLFGVSPADPPTYLGLCALVLAVTLAASYAPAHRAATVDPMTALRQE